MHIARRRTAMASVRIRWFGHSGFSIRDGKTALSAPWLEGKRKASGGVGPPPDPFGFPANQGSMSAVFPSRMEKPECPNQRIRTDAMAALLRAMIISQVPHLKKRTQRAITEGAAPV